MSAWIDRPTLRGQLLQLEPLQREHIAPLQDAVADGELWRLWYTTVPAPDAIPAWMDKALAARDEGTGMPFVVRSSSGEIVGSTRFYDMQPQHRRLSIGHTWYAERVQRSGINTEAKLLLLRYAFEHLQAIAVEFRTHWMNQRSRAAISRIGARQDGVLRNHMILPDGSWRDTVVFSIIQSEWPAVRQNLHYMLEQRSPQP